MNVFAVNVQAVKLVRMWKFIAHLGEVFASLIKFQFLSLSPTKTENFIHKQCEWAKIIVDTRRETLEDEICI